MSSSARLRELMRYADGELTEDEVATLRAAASDVELASASAAIEQLGDFVRTHAHARSRDFTVVDAVMRRIDPAAPPPVRPLPSAWWTLAAAGLGAAAAVAVLLTPPPREPARDTEAFVPASSLAGTGAGSAGTAGRAEVPAVLSTEEGAAGASIEALDTGARGATLFVVEAGSVTTPVVWLDEGEDTRDRMGPL